MQWENWGSQIPRVRRTKSAIEMRYKNTQFQPSLSRRNERHEAAARQWRAKKKEHDRQVTNIREIFYSIFFFFSLDCCECKRVTQISQHRLKYIDSSTMNLNKWNLCIPIHELFGTTCFFSCHSSPSVSAACSGAHINTRRCHRIVQRHALCAHSDDRLLLKLI